MMHMRRQWSLLAVMAMLLLASAAVYAAEKPKRVVSLSLCMDELVLALAERQHIAAVSRLALDERYSRLWRLAEGLPTHAGLAEQIVAVKPDLILGADYEQGKAVQALRQLGFPVQTLASPVRLADVPGHVRAVASLLHEEARAEQLLQQYQARLQHAQQRTATQQRRLALSLAPNGYTAGQHSIKNELLKRIGYDSAAERLGLAYDAELDLETLLWLQPERIFLEEQFGNQDALAHRLLQHPALRASKTNRQLIAFPSASWLCPGLGLADAAQALAEAH